MAKSLRSSCEHLFVLKNGVNGLTGKPEACLRDKFEFFLCLTFTVSEGLVPVKETEKPKW
jgi:hypothetical protein